jgi:cytochrome bd ubiquinol oxidase subunit II
MDNASIWFALSAVLFIGWTVMDGFDLGVGAIFLFMQGDKERGAALRAIGPVWNGNEVWLIGAVGSLLAAFPPVYGALLSGLYIPAILVLLCVIGRGVALELRGRVEKTGTKTVCEVVFSLASALIAFLVGLVGANVLRGLPLDASGVMVKSALRLFSPFALAAGLLSLSAFALHGANWLSAKAGTVVSEKGRSLALALAPALLLLAAASLVSGAFQAPRAMPWAAPRVLPWVFAILALAAGAGSYVTQRSKAPTASFLLGGGFLAFVVAWLASTLYPALVPSSIDPSYNLTVANAAVGPTSLTTLLVLAAIGVPLVLVVTVLLYRAFRGRPQAGEEDY